MEIPQKSWQTFCDRMNVQHDALMDIRQQSEGGGDLHLVAKGVPLESMNFYEGDACNNSLVIEFGAENERHCIIDPGRLILRKENGSDHFNLLEMPAESGTTVVTFHPGIRPALLDELEMPVPA